ncbi:hypothetical protein [Streptomyces sp. HUAS TT20]|uniref:hypothetical protein n=1 Tax=Streptomyces sp. HUAS TT20 TaxID=3447509 RepID=UPI0021D9F084|nr:hypothetical protein [Streptomyces sp. HUAS 15-9]UXY25309.1 hypothetical protein N8I87_01140 [Streptomyces sp. HUAS 15-9]
MTGTPSESTPSAGPDRATPPAAPRWVKVSGAVALAAVVVFLVLHLSGVMGSGMHGGH